MPRAILVVVVWSIRAVLCAMVLLFGTFIWEVAGAWSEVGFGGVESWFYWHILVLDIPLQDQTPIHVVHRAHQFYLTVIFFLLCGQVLLAVHNWARRKLKPVT